jgi:hypothetical protein
VCLGTSKWKRYYPLQGESAPTSVQMIESRAPPA